MDLEKRLHQIEETTMAQLKDFQCATVERIDELFCHGQNRVLVADEVGLGKTLIARGTIAKAAVRNYQNGNDIFKIVYICSNQVIANQNIRKLDVFNSSPNTNVSDSRLSMQHLRITEQELDAKKKGEYAQLIPLTPTTSFSMTSGGGKKEERALMYAILFFLPDFADYLDILYDFISLGVNDWDRMVESYIDRIIALDEADTGYPENVFEKFYEINKRNGIIQDLIIHLEEYYNEIPFTESNTSILQKLRKVFAEISVSMLQPDLVIMDEFQRFRFLIDSDLQESETGMLVQKFFSTKDLKVVLLSATPYKLYSTYEEIEDSDKPDDYYKEFFQVISFLNNDDVAKMNHFTDVWNNYSVKLREVVHGDSAVLSLKQNAENEMYNLICRTERISVMDSGDYIDDSSVNSSLKISSGDIHSFVDMGKMLQSIGEDRALLVDYAKSAPYLMSYMNRYKVKERAEKYFASYPDETTKAMGEFLWIDREVIEHYGELPANNSRLEELKRQVFYNNSELYMWVPPSKPYYDLEGVYKNSKGFSKMLVFSSWEMVPKMIGSMISYEAERRTVGIVSNDEKVKSTNNTYFTESKLRYPVARLRFNISKGEPRGMYLFCLIYPSETLAEIYNPIEYMNAGYSLGEIREYLMLKIDDLLRPIRDEYECLSVREDRRWYYMAPVLLDSKEYVDKWIYKMLYTSSGVIEDDDLTGFGVHIRKLRDLFHDEMDELGKVPEDLSEVLADIAIGSFATCAYRANGGDAKSASDLARVFINRFNSTEATSIVMLSYANSEDNDGHWRNVLRYCCDGGFGAMLDEYIHMVSEGNGFGLSEEKNRHIHNEMMEALKLHSASYVVDTYPAFERRMKGEKYKRTSMRSHYAVGFTKSDGDESKNVERKESLRDAFNSPLRPFVLATTSIGQEGLDFHLYCRKIMHWNLPSNPIDLEQREGRINRYKCLAIRQDIAQRYSDREFNSDVWQELFAMAVNEIKEEGHSDLVPFWCLGKNQNVKIERIVPMYPISKDEVNYNRLVKVLTLYRLTMGQTRQEELINYLIENGFTNDDYSQQLFINLSPYTRTDEAWRKMMRAREPIVEEKRKTSRQIKKERLQKEIDALNEQISAVIKQKQGLPELNTIGMKVFHKKYKDGIVKGFSQDGRYIYVLFSEAEKTLKYPGVLEEGILRSEYDDYLEILSKHNRIDQMLNDLEQQLNEYNEQLSKIVN